MSDRNSNSDQHRHNNTDQTGDDGGGKPAAHTDRSPCTDVVLYVSRHRPNDPDCSCDECTALDFVLADVDAPEGTTSAAGPTVVSPDRSNRRRRSNNGVEERSRSQRRRVEQREDVPDLEAETAPVVIDLTETRATVTPQGPFALGCAGPSSVLAPRGYGLKSSQDITLLNRLSQHSGTMAYNVVACNFERESKSYQQRAMEAMDLGNQLYGSAGIDVSAGSLGVNPYISSLVEQTCYPALKSVGMTYCNTMNDVLKTTETGPALRTGQKFNFLFTVIPFDRATGGTTSFSPKGRTLMERGPDGKPQYNLLFWDDFIVTRRSNYNGRDRTFSTIDMLMQIPSWCVPDPQLSDHKVSCETVTDIGCGSHLVKESYLLNMKQQYCYYFVKAMKSKVTAAAYEHGFLPLWLIKNALLIKKPEYGLNGFMFTTIDMTPKSYVHLVGYFRGSKEKGDLSIVTLVNEDNFLLAAS